MNRKGYFFILDAFLAATILAVSLVAIMNSGTSISSRTREFTQSDNIANLLAQTRIQDINNENVKDMIKSGAIADPKVTVMQQVDIFYYQAEHICGTAACKKTSLNNAAALISNITEPMIPAKYGYSYSIIEGPTAYMMFNRSVDRKESSDTRMVTRRMAFTRINQTTIFRPHVIEVAVWQR